jgi:hypothetical protein
MIDIVCKFYFKKFSPKKIKKNFYICVCILKKKAYLGKYPKIII